jgi:hypothetical protein
MRTVRSLSVLLAAFCGIVVLLDYFITDPALDAVGRAFVSWVTLLAAAAFVLGIVNLARVHGNRVAQARPGWQYSLALLGALLLTLLLGLGPGSGGASDPALSWVFTYVYQPLNAAIFSLLAFYIATAAYRALRLNTWEGGGLLVAGVIVLLGQIPLGAQVWDALPQARTWLLAVVGTAGLRGVIIAASLGAIMTGLRVILGLDRHYLDKDS